MSGQGRGRSQGRGRGQEERRTQQRPAAPGDSARYGQGESGRQGSGGYRGQQQPSSSQQPAGAWGRRPGPSSSAAPPTQAPYSRAPQQPQRRIHPIVKGLEKSGSRATHRLGPKGDGAPGYAADAPQKVEAETSGSGGGGDVVSLGRGSMRGRRIIADVVNTRPQNLVSKKGVKGNNVMLQANYFKMLATTDWCLYQYRVDFAPEEDRTAVRKGLLRLHKDKLGAYIFDGTVLYTSNRLADTMEFWSARQSDDTKIKIDIRLVGDMMRGDPHYIQFFNIIMRKCLELLKLQLVGRDYYDARSKVEVREFRLELWPGYFTSIRQHERDILMCAEITHKVMRQQTLLDILNDCYNKNSSNFQASFAAEVSNLVVLTDYNNETYRVEDVDFEVSPSSTFQLRNGEEISYMDYYKNKYQITIRNRSQPMLITTTKPRDRRAGPGHKVYLVPELCRATGLTDNMRNNWQLMKALAEHTRVAPQTRIQKLLAFNRRLRGEQTINDEFTQWNLKLDDRLVEVPGRVLPDEKIVLGNNRTVSSGQYADWTRDLQDKLHFNPSQLNNWVVVHVSQARHQVESFLRMLQDVTRSMGCKVQYPRLYEIRDDRAATYASTIEDIMSRANPDLIFCVVSNNRADRYSAIKKKCTVDRPVPSQVFLQKNLSSKQAKSICTKVAIQMNCKIGGAPWTVELPNINLMVMGFDVCHDTTKKKSYGALVASLDRGLSRYFSAVSHHSTGEELSNELAVNIAKALQNYRQMNQSLPSHILFYRDGVGEGQIEFVYRHEVEQIKTTLAGIYGDPSLVKMAFIIVTKRINTRFFLRERNPPPGTIIDDVVTCPIKYDFYVVSQSVKEGTVSPTAYNVLADSIGWSPDQIQRITFKMTHMYYNCSYTLRVPAPCQYAHKLAFLVSQFTHNIPSTQMENLLYFL